MRSERTLPAMIAVGLLVLCAANPAPADILPPGTRGVRHDAKGSTSSRISTFTSRRFM